MKTLQPTYNYLVGAWAVRTWALFIGYFQTISCSIGANILGNVILNSERMTNEDKIWKVLVVVVEIFLVILVVAGIVLLLGVKQACRWKLTFWNMIQITKLVLTVIVIIICFVARKKYLYLPSLLLIIVDLFFLRIVYFHREQIMTSFQFRDRFIEEA